MKRFFSVLTLIVAAFLVTACTKCTSDKPAEMPAVVEPPQAAPPVEGMPVDAAMPGDISAEPAADEPEIAD